MSVPKVLKDGKVAVLVSRGFGSGFSTGMLCDDNMERSLFDPTLISLIEQGASREKVHTAADLIYGKDESISRAPIEGLSVVWVPEGTKFLVAEYDGAEFIISIDDLKFTA